MYLQSIQLENYRRFQFAQTEFPDGIVGIIGNNGVGKSTLMEAIAWAMYGTVAARTGKTEIKRLNAKPQEVCRVILNFELQGENYQVVRELKGASNQQDASVLINGKVASRGATAVANLIEKTLDMDYRDFITSFYAPQKELNVLSDYPPYKRKEVLARMLGIERIDSALKCLRADIREIEMKVDIGEVHLKDLKELKGRKKEVKEKSQEYFLKIKKAEKSFKDEENSLKVIEDELKKKKEDFEVFNKLRNELSVKETLLSENISKITKNKREIQELENLTVELEKLTLELKNYPGAKEEFLNYESLKLKSKQRINLAAQMENLLRSIDADKKRIVVLDQNQIILMEKIQFTEKLKNESLRIEEQLEKTRAEFIQAQSEFKITSEEQKKLQIQLEGIEKLGPDSVCERCLRPMGDDYPKIREHLSSELEKIGEKFNKVSEVRMIIEENGKKLKKNKIDQERNIEKLQKEIEELHREKGEQETLEKGLQDKERNLAFLKENLSSLGELNYNPAAHQELKTTLDRLDKSNERFVALKQEMSKVPQLKEDLTQSENFLRGLNAEIEDLKNKINLLSYSEDEFKNTENKVEEKRKEVHQIELNLKDLYHRKEVLSLELEKIKQEMEETLKLKEELKSFGEDKLYLEKLNEILTGLRTSLISRIRPALSAYARELFLELTDGRYVDLELNEEYEIFIFDQGERFSIERFSGGEKDLANLCLRLAISLLISESSGVEFSFIILDEIFGSQDASRKENILRGLAKLKNRFRQIFLITHIDDIKDSVENLITVLEDEDGTSQLILQ